MRCFALFSIVAFAAIHGGFAAAQTIGLAAPQDSEAQVAPAFKPTAIPLWRDLTSGQTVAQVSAHLSAYPEVSAVRMKTGKKGKPNSLKVSMKDGGISIYGSSFSVETTFDVAGHLTEVTLISNSECANEAVDKYENISTALAEKYGNEVTGNRPLTNLAVSSALFDSHESERNETITYGFANESVVVAFTLAFSKAKAPVYYGGGGVTEGLYAIAKGIHDSQKEKCRNSGDETVTYAIKYLTKSDFDARAEELNAKQQAEDKQADKNL